MEETRMAQLPLALFCLAAATPPQGEVTLTLDEYRQLVEQAAQQAPEIAPPVEWSVRQASYHVSASGAQAHVKMSAVVDVLSAHPSLVPLLGNASALVMTKVDGQAAGAQSSDDRYGVHLKRGTHTIEM